MIGRLPANPGKEKSMTSRNGLMVKGSGSTEAGEEVGVGLK